MAGCGGSSVGFAERADAICLKRERATAALPDPRNPDEAAALYERQVGFVENEVRELAALDAPGDAALAGLLAQIRAGLAAAEQLRIASPSGDSESAQGAYTRGRRAARRAHRYVMQLGLKVCAQA